MSKRESLLRYSIIIRILRRAPATSKMITGELIKESILLGYDLSVSKRTLQRDLDDIRSLYGIDIVFDFSARHYSIEDDQNPDLSSRVLEAFDVMNAFNISSKISGNIGFERGRPSGTESIFTILQSLGRRNCVTFSYLSFWAEEASVRITEPYGIKEFRRRWYLVSRDRKDGTIKCFALDRISDLKTTNLKYELPAGFNIGDYFSDCFGIIRPQDEEPQEVELAFDPHQGKYVKSLPLHHSQVVVADNDEELRIRLKLFITHDFVMELLSFGDTVIVVAPQSLADEIKKVYENAITRY